mmetsp:Transcript_20079/g.47201  ORF Transcript_20079/g.47201 Transcript_20079/m.47201 type:complete len:88 (-) Transcript_20079:1230-1493(-)
MKGEKRKMQTGFLLGGGVRLGGGQTTKGKGKNPRGGGGGSRRPARGDPRVGGDDRGTRSGGSGGDNIVVDKRAPQTFIDDFDLSDLN